MSWHHELFPREYIVFKIQITFDLTSFFYRNVNIGLEAQCLHLHNLHKHSCDKWESGRNMCAVETNKGRGLHSVRQILWPSLH